MMNGETQVNHDNDDIHIGANGPTDLHHSTVDQELQNHVKPHTNKQTNENHMIPEIVVSTVQQPHDQQNRLPSKVHEDSDMKPGLTPHRQRKVPVYQNPDLKQPTFKGKTKAEAPNDAQRKVSREHKDSLRREHKDSLRREHKESLHGEPRQRKISAYQKFSTIRSAVSNGSSNHDNDDRVRNRSNTLNRRDHGNLSKSGYGSDDRLIVTMKMNTYKLEPDVPFSEPAVRRIIEDVLRENLQDATYSGVCMGRESQHLSDAIKRRVVQLGMRRYKVVCVVVIGQVTSPAVEIASRCLWNQNFDNYASALYKTRELYATGTVFGVYFE